jgi:hypothetical protein
LNYMHVEEPKDGGALFKRSFDEARKTGNT